MREALFSRLEIGAGTRVLDLYAGTGALGIEALSRGAERAEFVDRSHRALTVLRRNLEALSLDDVSRVRKADAVAALRRFGAERVRFDLILVDPPYDAAEVERALEALVACRVLAKGATVVVESAKRSPPNAPRGLVVRDRRDYGDTTITWLAETAGDDPEEPPEDGG